MSQKLWQPLGMEQEATWLTDSDGPQGMEAAASFRNVTLRDYAQFRIAIRKQGELERQADTSGTMG